MEKSINISDQWDFCVDYMWIIATREFDDDCFCVCGVAVPLPPAVDKEWILESFCFYSLATGTRGCEVGSISILPHGSSRKLHTFKDVILPIISQEHSDIFVFS